MSEDPLPRLHLHPVGDGLVHVLYGDDCPCVPNIRPVLEQGLVVGWTIVHRPRLRPPSVVQVVREGRRG